MKVAAGRPMPALCAWLCWSEAEGTYDRWLGNFDRRVELERRQLDLIRRGDLGAAASLAARIPTLEAQGDADGIAFGLRACVSDGPAGAPAG